MDAPLLARNFALDLPNEVWERILRGFLSNVDFGWNGGIPSKTDIMTISRRWKVGFIALLTHGLIHQLTQGRYLPIGSQRTSHISLSHYLKPQAAFVPCHTAASVPSVRLATWPMDQELLLLRWDGPQ
jgi:hypothetical protein